MQQSIPGLFNFRDPTTSWTDQTGTPAQSGVLFRSSALNRLDAAGRAELDRLGIRTVVDLREPDESVAAPDSVSARSRVLSRPIYGAPAPRAAPLRHVYRHIMNDRPIAVTRAVQAVLRAPEGGVLVHCAAGKDRTGIVIAVLLAAAGVGTDGIIADYTLSAGQLPAEHKEMTSARLQREIPSPAALKTALHLHLASPPEAISEVVDMMDKGFGGAAGFLLAHGADADDLHRADNLLTARECSE